LAVLLEARHDDAGSGFHPNLGFRAQRLVVHEAHKAARAVAALLDLATVGVEDAVAEIRIGPGRAFHQQDLVATDAEMAIGDELELGRAQIHALRNRVEHHEIVAEAVHFGELKLHNNKPPQSRKDAKKSTLRGSFAPWRLCG